MFCLTAIFIEFCKLSLIAGFCFVSLVGLEISRCPHKCKLNQWQIGHQRQFPAFVFTLNSDWLLEIYTFVFALPLQMQIKPMADLVTRVSFPRLFLL